MHLAFRILPVLGMLTAELYSLLGCCVFVCQIHMHFAFRVLSVPGFMIARQYSLLGFCIFLRQIHMHFAFRVLTNAKKADCSAVFSFRVLRFLTPH